MNNVVYDNSTFEYPAVAVPKPDNGVSYFDDKWIQCFHATISATATGSYSHNYGIATNNNSRIIVFHVYGTVTKDLADEISFYHLAETNAADDPTIIIPANQHNKTDYIDWTLVQTSNIAYYNFFRIHFAPCDSNYKVKENSTYTLNLSVDCYSL